MDANEFVRLAEAGPQNRRRTSIAAPPRMYQRIVKLRHQMMRQQAIARRSSFSFAAKVDKEVTEEDSRLRESFSKELLEGVRLSLNVARKVMLPKGLVDNPLAVSGITQKSKAGRTLLMSKFTLMLVPYQPLQSDCELRSILLRFVDRRMQKLLKSHDPIVSVSQQLDRAIATVAGKQNIEDPIGGGGGGGGGGGSGRLPSFGSPTSKVIVKPPSIRSPSGGGGGGSSRVGLVSPMSSSVLSPGGRGGGGGGGGNCGGGRRGVSDRLAGLTAAEKLKVEREEERAMQHLRRRKRRHSLGAPERTPALVELWRQHLGLVGSLRLNPLQNGEHCFGAYGSGARDDDLFETVRRRLGHGEDGPFELHRMERSDWGDESKMIELSAEQAGFNLDDPAVREAAEQQRTAEKEVKRLKKERERAKWEQAQRSKEAERNGEPIPTAASAASDTDTHGAVDGGFLILAAGDGVSGTIGTGGDISTNNQIAEMAAAQGPGVGPYGGSEEWYEAYGDDGSLYYYSNFGQTAWELPQEAVAVSAGSGGGGDGQDYAYGGEWEQHVDGEGYTYWYNASTGESYYDSY